MTQIEIAPMLDWTTRHYRYFMRNITKHTRLYTEMIVSDAIINGNCGFLLGFNPQEHPLVLQLGGSDPNKLAKASKIASSYGYDEINLNVGCPSSRVKSGNFGACLMQEPHLVKDCLSAIKDAVDIKVSVKHRVGLGYDYSYEFLHNFVDIVKGSGCNKYIVHARNAILEGLSPKQNREIPPLEYEYVYRLKRDFPHLEIILNGGVTTFDQIDQHIKQVDGVMLGREAYYNPYLFAAVDQKYYNDNHIISTRFEVAKQMIEYLQIQADLGTKLRHITAHMLGLFHGCPNAKLWRTTLTDTIAKTNDINVYIELLENKFGV